MTKMELNVVKESIAIVLMGNFSEKTILNRLGYL
jgi:hypothetical protein